MFQSMLNNIQAIGQMVILRGMICNILSTAGRVDSDKLFHSLVNMNHSLINDLMNRPPEAQKTQEENEEQENEVYLVKKL
jgi:hypothetical protein